MMMGSETAASTIPEPRFVRSIRISPSISSEIGRIEISEYAVHKIHYGRFENDPYRDRNGYQDRNLYHLHSFLVAEGFDHKCPDPLHVLTPFSHLCFVYCTAPG
jgi:hypothetical protein